MAGLDPAIQSLFGSRSHAGAARLADWMAASRAAMTMKGKDSTRK
jgi:hypothetical protein